MESLPPAGDSDASLAGLAGRRTILARLRMNHNNFHRDMKLPGAPQPVVTVARVALYDENEVAAFFGRPLHSWNADAEF